MLKTAVPIGSSSAHGEADFRQVADFVVECESLGVDTVWTGEAWGMDAMTPLAYMAARTSKIRLCTGIASVSARSPGNLAMTAMTIAALSNNRFVLGLGVSGPQVVEGLHGVSFAKPLGRMKELIDILKLAFAGEPLKYDGEHYKLPLPGGTNKALKIGQAPNPNIPIFLATLGPKSLEYTGEVADGWLGHSFTPSTADVYLDPIRRGAEQAGRDFGAMEIAVGVVVGIGDDVEKMIAKRKPAIAFQLGAMGTADTNFYTEAFRRTGYQVDAVNEVQRLWVAGKREEAAARVPDEMALETSIIGTDEMVRDRLRKYRASGVTLLQIQAMGRSPERKLETIGRINELIREVEGV